MDMLLMDPRTGEHRCWDSLDEWIAAGGNILALRLEAAEDGDWEMLQSIADELGDHPECDLCMAAGAALSEARAGIVTWEDPDTEEELQICIGCEECVAENARADELTFETLAQWEAAGEPDLCGVCSDFGLLTAPSAGAEHCVDCAAEIAHAREHA